MSATRMTQPGERRNPVGEVAEQLLAEGLLLARTMLAGSLLGVLTVGVLARLAMRLLAVVNETVRGVRSDDGFLIGVMSLDGSLELASTGVLLGALSGLLHAALSPLQVGPAWFRTLSISVGAGTVVGALLVHTDGVDFTFLRPPWLTVGMFVLIPVVHVAALDLLCRRIRAGTLLRHRGWALVGAAPLVLLAPFVAILAALRAALLLARRTPHLARRLAEPVWGHAARLVLAAVFVLALIDLARDVARIR